MAKNREPVKPVIPDTESGEEEDEGGSSEQEPDLQLTPIPFSPTSAVSAKKPQSHSASQLEPLSSSDEESDSESDPPKPSNGARKPRSMLASAGVRDEPEKSINGARKPRSKPVAAGKPDKPKKSSNGARKPRSKPVPAGKRPAEEKETDCEKLLEETPDKIPTTDSKKPPHLRLWSDDDVIVVLKGMVDYSVEKKADPVADLDGFLHFIKSNLHADVTRRQLHDKIRKLKGKYDINKKKERRGKEMILPNLYEQMAYELSKIIWGKKGNENEGEKGIVSAKANGSVVRRPLSKRKGSEGSVLVAKRAKTVEEMVLMTGDKLFENGEEVDEWSKLKIQEMETYLQHLEVKTKQTKLVLDRLKSGGC